MRKKSHALEIERIVLTDLALTPARTERIRTLVEAELQRRLERGGWLDDLTAGDVRHLEAPAMRVDPSDGDGPFAHGLAKSISHAVRRVKEE